MRALALLVALSLQDPKASQWTPTETMKVKTVGDVQPSPDGRRVVFAVATAVMAGEKSEMLTHVWVANADGTDGRPFTSGDKSSSSPQWSPDGKWIYFVSKRAEHGQLWRMRSDGGEAEQLTEGKAGVGAFAPSPDGQAIAFVRPDEPSAAEERSKKEKTDVNVVDEGFKFNRIWVVPAGQGKREARLLTRQAANVDGRFDWSPDGKTIVFSHTPTPGANDWVSANLSVVDVATEAVTPLVRTGAAETQPHYSPDGKWIAYAVSEDPPTWPGDTSVAVVAAGGGEPKRLAGTFDRKPTIMGWSADGKRVYFQEARGTITRLSALPVDGGAPVDIDGGDRQATYTRLNVARTMVGFVGQTSDRAPEGYVAKLDSFAPVQISVANGDLPKAPLGRTDVIRWKSPDGLEIEGLLTYPAGYEKGRRCPLILNIHGGPAGVFNQSFIAGRGVYPIAAFAARGYAVLRPNPRGSSGYGKAFRHANRKDWGGGDFKDLMAGVDHVIAMGVADPERLGVMGWSYGGFMTSWTITQTKRFKAACVGAAVTNLMSFNGTADIPGFVPDYFGAEFWENLDLYKEHCAMFQVKGVTTPTLILHGENDVRVPISQGYELYNALKRQNVHVRMVTYPRQGHGITEPKFVLDCAQRQIEWFDRHLSPEGGK
jgi:dipeptidyl aminopeptidase/acylaminoacyl peptidase